MVTWLLAQEKRLHCPCDGRESPDHHSMAAKKALDSIAAMLLPTLTRPEFKIDEQWSYVGNKGEAILFNFQVFLASCNPTSVSCGEENTCDDPYCIPTEGIHGAIIGNQE
jgi:hypothetical protein